MVPWHGIDWLVSACGFAVGALIGMTGMGGGSLMTPILILLFDVHPAAAVGTDLLYASLTKSGGTLAHGLNRNVDWRVVRRLATGSVPMTALALFVLSKFDLTTPGVQTVITVVLSLALFVTALTLIFRKKILSLYGSHVGELHPRRVARATIAVGAALGVLVSISSVGAGAIGVTGLILLYPRMSTARIVGSDIAHAVPLTLAAGIGHWIMGSINIHILGSLLLGSLPGILLGSYVAGRIPDPVLRMLLATVLIIVAGRLVM